MVRKVVGLLAHYFPAAYRYGSEELLRTARIAIPTSMVEQATRKGVCTMDGATVYMGAALLITLIALLVVVLRRPHGMPRRSAERLDAAQSDADEIMAQARAEAQEIRPDAERQGGGAPGAGRPAARG